MHPLISHHLQKEQLLTMTQRLREMLPLSIPLDELLIPDRVAEKILPASLGQGTVMMFRNH